MLRSALFTFSCIPALVVCVGAGASLLRAGDDCPQGVSFSLDSEEAVDGLLDVALDGSADAEFSTVVHVTTSFEDGLLQDYAVTASYDR